MTADAPQTDASRIEELELALENRVAALAALHERSRQVEAERSALESRLAEVQQECDLAAAADSALARQVENLEHRLRTVEHEAAVEQFQLKAALHEAREQLAEATQRAVAAEQHPLRQLVGRLRRRLRPG